MPEHVVGLGFDGVPPARHALRALGQLHQSRQIRLGAAAVVGRRDDGRAFAVEQAAQEGGATAAGGVESVLTGPFGLVLEEIPGALVGSLVDVADSRRSDQLVRCFGDDVLPGTVVTVALVTEATPEPVDALAARLGAVLTRRAREDVEREIAEAGRAPRRPVGHRFRRIVGALRPRR